MSNKKDIVINCKSNEFEAEIKKHIEMEEISICRFCKKDNTCMDLRRV